MDLSEMLNLLMVILTLLGLIIEVIRQIGRAPRLNSSHHA